MFFSLIVLCLNLVDFHSLFRLENIVFLAFSNYDLYDVGWSVLVATSEAVVFSMAMDQDSRVITETCCCNRMG